MEEETQVISEVSVTKVAEETDSNADHIKVLPSFYLVFCRLLIALSSEMK